jgi:hypothetical protein
MTKVRRLVAISGLLALAALVSARQLWGDPPTTKDRGSPLPGAQSRPRLDPHKNQDDYARIRAKFERGGLLTYQPQKGDLYFAWQLKPAAAPTPARPRDLVVVLSNAAGQAGIPWAASRQLTQALCDSAGPDDRISLWTASTPEPKFTRAWTNGLIPVKQDAKKIEAALAELSKSYPAGDTDLKYALTNALKHLDASAGRQRVLLYVGDGQSLHNPLLSADRDALVRQMVENQVVFYSIPLGRQLNGENLNGLAAGTGGLVLPVRLLQDRAVDVQKRLHEAWAVPVFYSTRFTAPAEVTEYYPTQLPPLRSDTPTLVAGRMKAAKTLRFTVTGTVEGRNAPETRTFDEAVPAAEVDNYFLASVADQWKSAKDQFASMRADSALVLAYNKNELTREELNAAAQIALRKNELDTAQKFYAQVRHLAPHDTEAAAGLQIVASLRDGKTTLDKLREQFNQRERRAISKDGRTVALSKAEILALAQIEQEKAGAKDGEDLLQSQRDRMIIEEHRTQELVEGAIRRARADLLANPDEAYETLKRAQRAVQDNVNLSERVRTSLLSRLESNLRDTAIQGAAVKLRRAEEERRAITLEQQFATDARARAHEQLIEARFTVFRNLMNEARLDRLTADRVLHGLAEMAMDNIKYDGTIPPVVTAAYRVTEASYVLNVMKQLKRKKEYAWLRTMLEIEKSHVPIPDEPGIYFPDRKLWEAITKIRKDKYSVSSLPDDYKARAETEKTFSLMTEGQITFTENAQVPLPLALKLLEDSMKAQGKKLSILIDSKAVAAGNEGAGDVETTQVKLTKREYPITLGTALQEIISQFQSTNDRGALTWMIRRNYVEVTTVDVQQRDKVLQVYPVADLVIPVPSAFNQNQVLGTATILGTFGAAGALGALGGGLQFGGLGALGGGIGGGLGALGGFGGGLGGLGGGLGALGGLGGGLGALGGLGGGLGALGGLGGGLGALGLGGGLGALGLGGGLGALGVQLGGVGALGVQLGGVGALGLQLGQQNCLGVNLGAFNGNFGGPLQLGGQFGIQGRLQNQLLIATIQQVVAPGEWGPLACQPGGVPGITNPAEQGGPIDIREANTLGFYPVTFALVVRATSRKHTSTLPGHLTVRPKRDIGIGGVADHDPSIVTPPKKGGKDGQATKPGQLPLGQRKEKDLHLEANKIWQDALEKGVSDPGIIIATADFLFQYDKYEHTAEFLKANLRQGILVRPWVFEALAIALEASGAPPDEIRRARLSAADLEPQDFQGFLKAARVLAEHRQYDRALVFCRQAAAVEPNLPFAYADALEYAELAKDAQAMQWAAQRLLLQDWPADSRELHHKTQLRVDGLLRTLEKENRTRDAERLKAALADVRRRDLVVNLKWEAGASGAADLELQVKEPSGTLCSPSQRQTPGGGTLIGNNLGDKSATYVAAEGFAGDYEVTVRHVWGQPLWSKATLEIILHQGTPDEERRLETIDLTQRDTVRVALRGGRRTQLASVPPPAAYERVKSRLNVSRGENIVTKLRDVAMPEYASAPPTAMVGAAGSSGNPSGMDEELLNTSARRAEILLRQSGISSTATKGLNLTSQVMVSSTGDYLRESVTAVFPEANRIPDAPTVSLPVIPGASRP